MLWVLERPDLSIIESVRGHMKRQKTLRQPQLTQDTTYLSSTLENCLQVYPGELVCFIKQTVQNGVDISAYCILYDKEKLFMTSILTASSL